ncbi:MAG: sigma-70 family RNA polymerase sigma factor [Candidatus Zixiibacteriota bacterium]
MMAQLPSKEPSFQGVDLTPDDEHETRRLVNAFRRGDQQAYARIVQRYRNPVTSLAYRMVRDYDEAADIAQDVFVKMARNIDRYDDHRKFYTWLYRITVNASIDHIRRNQRHQHESLESFSEVEERQETGPELTYLRERLRTEIRNAADKLNAKQRSAFLLRDIGERKVDDVAGIMEMPEATVRWYLHRARSRIRKELLRRCPHLLFLLGIR